MLTGVFARSANCVSECSQVSLPDQLAVFQESAGFAAAFKCYILTWTTDAHILT